MTFFPPPGDDPEKYEELTVMCFDCGLNFRVITDNPAVVQMFAEAGCLSPTCNAVHALFVTKPGDDD